MRRRRAEKLTIALAGVDWGREDVEKFRRVHDRMSAHLEHPIFLARLVHTNRALFQRL